MFSGEGVESDEYGNKLVFFSNILFSLLKLYLKINIEHLFIRVGESH